MGVYPSSGAGLTTVTLMPILPAALNRGDVPKWPKAGVCKTPIRRFESARRLHLQHCRPNADIAHSSQPTDHNLAG